MRIRVVLKDRYYVPIEHVRASAVRRELEIPINTKEHCRPNCPVARKPNRWCSTCPSLNARVKMWEIIRTPSGRAFVAVPSGSPEVLASIVKGSYVVDDRRTRKPLRSGLRWTGRLWRGQIEQGEQKANQRKMLAAWRAHVNGGATAGIICSPPRTGKCVAAGTIVGTEFGYVPIENIFSCYGIDPTEDVERIGTFGKVATSSGYAPVRGLYSRVVDETWTVTTSLGAAVTGTPEHPLAILRGEMFMWVRLDRIRVGDTVIIPRRLHDPPYGKKLTVTQAKFFGTVAAIADPQALVAGVLDIKLSDVECPAEFSSLAHQVLGVDVPEHLVVHLTSSRPELTDWRSLLLESDSAVWRAFLDAHALHSPILEVTDRRFARAAHSQLLGMSIPSELKKSSGVYTLTLPMNSASDDAIRDVVVSVRKNMHKTRVYDIMVPSCRQFIANGLLSHNTVLGVAGAMAQRQRAVILASKIDFLRQFGRRFGECTNVRDLYAEGKYPVVLVDKRGWSDGPRFGIHVVKKWDSSVPKADIVLSPYQQFMNTTLGQERFAKFVANSFGMLIADEIHQTGAASFSRVINRTNARFKMGLTATPKRGDGLMPVAHAVLGPVAAKGKITSTLPGLHLKETGIGYAKNSYNWNTLVKYLTEHAERNKIIVRQIFKDLRANPLNCILIPTTRVAHVRELIKMVNAQAQYMRKYEGESWPSELAVAYVGKSDTNAILNQIGAGNARVVVATAVMVQHGLDVSRWTHVYVSIIPTKNPYLMYQLVNRVCTPYSANEVRDLGQKPPAVVRFFLDAIGASVFCFAKLFQDKDYGIRAGLDGTNYIGTTLYRVGPKAMSRMTAVATYPRQYSPEDAGVKVVLGRTSKGKFRRISGWKKLESVTKF